MAGKRPVAEVPPSATASGSQEVPSNQALEGPVVDAEGGDISDGLIHQAQAGETSGRAPYQGHRNLRPTSGQLARTASVGIRTPK
eukprot:5265435-Amphidinium_carterae.1